MILSYDLYSFVYIYFKYYNGLIEKKNFDKENQTE